LNSNTVSQKKFGMELMTMTMMQQHPQQLRRKGDNKMSPSNDFGFDGNFSHGNEIKQEEPFDYSHLDEEESGRAAMRKLVNKLGGTYCSGKPLSMSTRRQIVAMAETGMKACDISRQLQISHGCVSKIISKWRATGSFEPRRIGGSKPKKTIGDVVAAVRIYKRACPSIRSLEIRRRLLDEGVCTECNVPSLSSINRIIRMKLRDDLAEFEANAVRDLMAILANTTAPVSAAEERPSHRPKLPPAPASFPMNPVEPCRLLHTNQFPAHVTQIPEQQQLQSNHYPAHYEAKMLHVPVPQLTLPLAPKVFDDKTPLHLGVIPKIRNARHSSTASSSSTTSSVCTDASFEIWHDEVISHGNANANDNDQQGLYSALFGDAHDMPILNFEGEDLWSLLDELA